MKYILVIFFSLQLGLTWSQDRRSADSLRTLIAKAKQDSNKINLMMTLGMSLEEENPKEALKTYQETLLLSRQLKYPRKEFSAMINQGIAYYLLGEWENAIRSYEEAFALAKKQDWKNKMGVPLVNIGNVYLALSQYPEAIEYYQRAEPYLAPDQQGKMAANMVNIFVRTNRIAESREYGYRAIKISEQTHDTTAWLDAHINLFSEDSDSLLLAGYRLQKRALPVALKFKDEYRIAALYTNIAVYYYSLPKKYDSALLYARHTEEIFKRIGFSQAGLIDSYNLMARIYLLRKDFISAKGTAMRALALAPKTGLVYKWKEIYLTLAKAEEGLKNYSSAIDFFKKYDHYRDSTDQVRNTELSNQLNTRYQSEKKQKEINRLELLEVEQQKEINFRNSLIAVAVIAFVFLAIIGFLFYRNMKSKQRLTEKEKEIQVRKINELEKDKQLVMTESIVRGQEEERSRLAKDLHDGLGGILWGVKSSLSTMKGNMILSGDNLQSFERSLDMLDTSISELRRVAHNLMPEALVKFGLASALRDFCDFVNNSKVIHVIFQQVGHERRLDLSVEVVLYRVANELVNNALKHSRAGEIIIQLNYDDHSLDMTVEDNGVGFDKTILEKTKGSGWPNIQSRIAYIKGTLDIETTPGNGTAVNITIPI
jgi:signal transduction histidine kinase/Tfp pilus assembly protein PilF